MDIVRSVQPAPRLLNTVVPDLRAKGGLAEEEDVKSDLEGARLFAGNGLAIFVGLVVGVLVLSTLGWLYGRHEQTKREALLATPIMLPVATDRISSSSHSAATPAPIVVQIAAEHIHVTSISLGHPRLAVINGQQVGEGDFVEVHAPTVVVTVKLRVLKIADGRIDLSDGTQVISTHLALPTKSSK